MRTALVALLALSGCVLPWGCPGAGEIGTVAWTQPGLYETLDETATGALTVVESVPARGIPFRHRDLDLAWTRYELRAVQWTPQGPTTETAPARPSAALAEGGDGTRLEIAVATGAGEAEQRAMLDAFLDRLGAPLAGREALFASMAANASEGPVRRHLHAALPAPPGLVALFDGLANASGPEVSVVDGATYRWPGWTFHFEVPWREARFDNDASDATAAAFDDDLPYVRLHARASGEIGLSRDGARFGKDLSAVTAWANATFARHGLPAPTYDGLLVDRAWCG